MSNLTINNTQYVPRSVIREQYMDVECQLCWLVVRMADNSYNVNSLRCRRCACRQVRIYR